jgi:hypothetical protein
MCKSKHVIVREGLIDYMQSCCVLAGEVAVYAA